MEFTLKELEKKAVASLRRRSEVLRGTADQVPEPPLPSGTAPGAGDSHPAISSTSTAPILSTPWRGTSRRTSHSTALGL